jgi:predicted SnoaL-like aldol condensation-catalyzing enzyme
MTPKETAIQFLNDVIAGRIDEAYDRFTDPQGRHHNVYFPAGFDALRKAMKENHVLFPNKTFTVQQVVAEGDFVGVRSKLMLKPGQPDMIAVHFFRFKDGKIVELWDCGQPVPPESPNKDGAF